MTNSKMLLEDVLDAIMFEETTPSHEALLRWITRYPQYRDELADFFATWGVQAVMTGEPEIDENEIVNAAVRHALEIARHQGKVAGVPSISPGEELVLTAVYLLHGSGHPATITEKVNEMSNTRVMFGTVYLALDRLEGKGLLSSSFSDENGRPRRLFTVTAPGERALAQAKERSKRLSDLLGDFA
jgi:DNA-binding MarR family transcriptional regulator